MSNKSKIKMPKTGNKAFDVIIVIILIISILGIIAFTYTGISRLCEGNVFKALPNIMYVLMYVSIIQYSVTFFIQHKKATIHSMLLSYCMLTLMCTLTLPNVSEHNLLLIIVVITVIVVPFIRGNLTSLKWCTALMWIVLALVAIATALKFYYGYSVLSGANPFLTFVAAFNAFHPLIVWIIFMILYAIRVNIVAKYDKKNLEEKGYKQMQAEYKQQLDDFLEEEKAEKKQAKAEKKEKIKEKVHHNS